MTTANLEKGPLNALVLMRILIGWHFLFEGVFKLHTPNWTAKGYLASADGFLSSFFIWLSGDGLIGMVDFLNISFLVIVGITLLLGYFERIGSILGVGLLLLYYLAHPAWPGIEQVGTEGNYWIVNKNLMEAGALLVLYYLPTGDYFGIKRLFGTSSVDTITSN